MAPNHIVLEPLAHARAEAVELARKLESVAIETLSLLRGPGADRMVAVGAACNAQRTALAALSLASAAATILALAPSNDTEVSK